MKTLADWVLIWVAVSVCLSWACVAFRVAVLAWARFQEQRRLDRPDPDWNFQLDMAIETERGRRLLREAREARSRGWWRLSNGALFFGTRDEAFQAESKVRKDG